MRPRAVDAGDEPDPPEEERPAKGSLSQLLRDLAGVPQRSARARRDRLGNRIKTDTSHAQAVRRVFTGLGDVHVPGPRQSPAHDR